MPTAPPHPTEGRESPVVPRLMASFKNLEDPLACAIVTESAMQGCLSAFSLVVIQYRGFGHIGCTLEMDTFSQNRVFMCIL